MQTYLDLLKLVLDTGVQKTDRTGTGTVSVFGAQAKFNLADGFPLLTTKKLHVKSIIHELLWFIRGDTNVHSLQEHGVTIWDSWADRDGSLGPIYGAQWRDWMGVNRKSGEVKHVDQLKEVIDCLQVRPDDRRMIVTAWQPAELQDMRLPSCHCLFHLNTEPLQSHLRESPSNQPRYRLNMLLYQRSCDLFLGVPFNIASYALLLTMIAQVCGMTPGIFTHTYGDLHLYLNHLDQAREQSTRAPRPLPKLELNPSVKDLFAFKYEDITIKDYNPHPPIKAEVSV